MTHIDTNANDNIQPASGWIEAKYLRQVIPQYRDVPFIEALPEIADDEQAIAMMQNYIVAEDEEKKLPAHFRRHMIPQIRKFMLPREQNVELFHRFGVLLRQGYIDRSPAEHLKRVLTDTAALDRALDLPPSGDEREALGSRLGLTCTGTTGVGKSTAIEAVLACYPQVICHSNLKGVIKSCYQLVWIKVTCPKEGSVRALCASILAAFDKALGTAYFQDHKKASAEILRMEVARLASIHGLGALVIDEIQNLSAAKSGGDMAMMNFFRVFSDILRVPVVFVGTEAADRILQADAQNARRHSDFPPFERMKNDEEFELFITSLADACYLQTPVQVTPELLSTMHDFTQGIPGLVLLLFMLAQYQALADRTEELTCELLDRTYQSNFGRLHPYLDRLRLGLPIDGEEMENVAKVISQRAATPGASGFSDATREEAARVAANTNKPTTSPQAAKRARAAVRKTLKNRGEREPTNCELVRIYREGLETGTSAHDALLAHGHIGCLDPAVFYGT